jgi:hypothetical protein
MTAVKVTKWLRLQVRDAVGALYPIGYATWVTRRLHLSNQVDDFLTTHTTLSTALAEWPGLRTLLPPVYKDVKASKSFPARVTPFDASPLVEEIVTLKVLNGAL